MVTILIRKKMKIMSPDRLHFIDEWIFLSLRFRFSSDRGMWYFYFVLLASIFEQTLNVDGIVVENIGSD